MCSLSVIGATDPSEHQPVLKKFPVPQDHQPYSAGITHDFENSPFDVATTIS